MGLHLKFLFLCVISSIWILNIPSYGLSTKPEAIKWKCTCSVAHQNTNFILVNCSSSCDCSPGITAAGGSSKNQWTCYCSGGLPGFVSEANGSSCFTACNCKAGTLSELEPPKKQISSKVVIIVLLLCVSLTMLAIIGSVSCYVYQKYKEPIQWVSSSLDRQKSYGSATNYMIRADSSPQAYKAFIGSSVKPFLGCIPKTEILSGGKTGSIIHGTILKFSYFELESATNRFSDANIIGGGGSSCVYQGSLRNGKIVAIKRLKTQGGPDAECVFLTEIELISRLHHCHVVPLLGYCSELRGRHAERLLVFEYIPNGNLRECLDGNLGKHLDWNTRVSIALGAARGLEYLHEAAAPKIMHRDVKSTNILLDEHWNAKISDLGMAKHLCTDGTLSCSSSPARMQGTFGYFAPEYAIIGRASLKSDVFSFGVVLLELITGRYPIHKTLNKEEESLVIWATPRLHDSRRVISELPDPHLEGNFQEEEMQVMAYLAKECLLLDPDSRPSMGEVVQILSTIAPDKSKRQNLRVHAFQHSLACNLEASNDVHGDSSASEEIKEITSETAARRSSPPSPVSDYCIQNETEAGHSFIENIEQLVLLTSKSRSWHLQDNEVVVHLTEPRLESFRLLNTD